MGRSKAAKADKAKPVPAELAGSFVVVQDTAAAKRLHERIAAGTLTADGMLRLSLVEAAWAAAQGRITAAERGVPVRAEELAVAAQKASRGGGGGGGVNAATLAVYSDLRERGLAIQVQGEPLGERLSVWPRGKSDGPPAYQVLPVNEYDDIVGKDLHTRGGVIYGIVDRDRSVTYYEAAPASPQGDGVEGVEHPAATGHEAHEPPPVGAARESLEEAGVTVRSGFRFGTHLRGYRGDPDKEHADWIVHCAAATDRLPWLQLARGIRVAHGVRKAFLVAVSGPDGEAAPAMGTAFVELSWFKP